MPQAVMLPSDVGTALSLQEFIDTWEDDLLQLSKNPLPPAKVQRLLALVTRAVQMASVLKIAWLTCTQEGSVWETRSYMRRVEALEFLARVVVDSLTRTQEIVARTHASHSEWPVPPEAEELRTQLPAAREILAKAQELTVWLNRKRPPVNEAMILRSQESLTRGEGESLNGILGRLKNGEPLVKE